MSTQVSGRVSDRSQPEGKRSQSRNDGRPREAATTSIDGASGKHDDGLTTATTMTTATHADDNALVHDAALILPFCVRLEHSPVRQVVGFHELQDTLHRQEDTPLVIPAPARPRETRSPLIARRDHHLFNTRLVALVAAAAAAIAAAFTAHNSVEGAHKHRAHARPHARTRSACGSEPCTSP